MEKRKLLLLSSSVVHDNQNFLSYAKNDICSFLKTYNVHKIVFIPFALHNCDKYEEKVKPTFNQFGFELISLHKFKDPTSVLKEADAIFIGGGNTFLLLKSLYDLKLVKLIQELVLVKGIPYIGSSAGTNVATCNICTTNDMPIVFPPSFNAINLVPFNINAHYIDVKAEGVKHMGETRDQRIEQYLEILPKALVVGLREGCLLRIEGNTIKIQGVKGARIFKNNCKPTDYQVGDDISFLNEIPLTQ